MWLVWLPASSGRRNSVAYNGGTANMGQFVCGWKHANVVTKIHWIQVWTRNITFFWQWCIKVKESWFKNFALPLHLLIPGLRGNFSSINNSRRFGLIMLRVGDILHFANKIIFAKLYSMSPKVTNLRPLQYKDAVLTISEFPLWRWNGVVFVIETHIHGKAVFILKRGQEVDTYSV